jgi:hypothetical protein
MALTRRHFTRQRAPCGEMLSSVFVAWLVVYLLVLIDAVGENLAPLAMVMHERTDQFCLLRWSGRRHAGGCLPSVADP